MVLGREVVILGMRDDPHRFSQHGMISPQLYYISASFTSKHLDAKQDSPSGSRTLDGVTGERIPLCGGIPARGNMPLKGVKEEGVPESDF